MALIKLSKYVILTKDVLPICLPESKHFPDETGEVYVAGWGSVADGNCTTGKFGPDPYTMCAPKFSNQNKSNFECITLPSPSANNVLCQQLLRSKNLIVSPEPVYTQTDILDDREKLLTTCFNFQLNNKEPFGWCATCQKHARPGQPGYCGFDALNNDEELVIPTATKGWGYCEKQCMPDYAMNKTLLSEVILELVSFEECKEMGSLKFDMLDIELCAAKPVCKSS